MTALAILSCAAALLVLPGRQRRLPVLAESRSPRRVETSGRVVLLGGLAAVVSVGITLIGGAYSVCAAGILVGTVWHRKRRADVRRLRRAETTSLIAGLETVIGELGVGSHPAIACGTAASEGSGSVATAFRRASGRARLGGTAHDGLNVPESPVSVELAMLAQAWRVADEHGLALAGLLAAARGDLLARSRFRDRTEASLAGARATGTVLASLPVVGVLLGQAMGASPLGVLLGGGLGGILLVVGASLACGGLLWTDAITANVCR